MSILSDCEMAGILEEFAPGGALDGLYPSLFQKSESGMTSDGMGGLIPGGTTLTDFPGRIAPLQGVAREQAVGDRFAGREVYRIATPLGAVEITISDRIEYPDKGMTFSVESVKTPSDVDIELIIYVVESPA